MIKKAILCFCLILLAGQAKAQNNIFPIRQFNEDAYNLRLVKAANERLYKLRYKYKIMGTEELLHEFQKRLDLYNYEYKYSPCWIAPDRTYYSIVDLLLSPDFDKMLVNISNAFYDKIPRSESIRLTNADQYDMEVSELIKDNTAMDYFITTEITARIKSKISAPLASAAYTPFDKLELFSDYGLMIGFLGEDGTQSIAGHDLAKKMLYEMTLNKIIKEGIQEKDVRTFVSEGRFVSNLREQAKIQKKRTEFAGQLKSVIPTRTPDVSYVEKDIQAFFEYALDKIADIDEQDERTERLKALANELPENMDLIILARGSGNELDHETIQNTIELVNFTTQKSNKKADEALVILNARSSFATKRLPSMYGATPTLEEVITMLQDYTGLPSTNMTQLKTAMILKLMETEGKIKDEDQVFLFGEKEDGSGYYNYASQNIKTNDDICELIILSSICFAPKNKNTITMSNLKFVATAFGKINPKYATEIAPLYENMKKSDDSPIGTIKSSLLWNVYKEGYSKLTEIKF